MVLLIRTLSALVLCGTLSGCFVTLTGGAYSVETTKGRKPGYGAGIHVGVYLDVEPVRVAVAVGADGAVASLDEDRQDQLVKGATIEGSYSLTSGRYWRARATAAATWGSGQVGIQPKGQSPDDFQAHEGECCGRSYFLGATFDVPFKEGSVSASLGPHYVGTRSAEYGRFDTLGAQLRLTVSSYTLAKSFGTMMSYYRPKLLYCRDVVDPITQRREKECIRRRYDPNGEN